MTIKIKPGDIVRYRGEIVRVMGLDMGASDSEVQLSHFGWIDSDSADNIELVESIPDTTLKDGDEVIIRDIPDDEKDMYGTSWVSSMDELRLSDEPHIIENVHYRNDYGWIGRIGRYTFQLYHIEPVNSFDII